MDQASLERQGFHRIGNGCYSTVYSKHGTSDKPFEWVLKHGVNDGTRTFLEWVLLKTARGERMRGMPDVEFVADRPLVQELNDGTTARIGMYLASMRRYDKVDWFELFGADNLRYPIHYDQRFIESEHRYIIDVVEAFEAETNVKAGDLHMANVMWDAKAQGIVVTDPSSYAYVPLGADRYSPIVSNELQSELDFSPL